MFINNTQKNIEKKARKRQPNWNTAFEEKDPKKGLQAQKEPEGAKQEKSKLT